MEPFDYELRDSGRITTGIRIEGEGMLAIHTALANRRSLAFIGRVKRME
jgi:hypothetical protein